MISMNDVCSDLVTILSLAMLSDYHEELLIKEIGVNLQIMIVSNGVLAYGSV